MTTTATTTTASTASTTSNASTMVKQFNACLKKAVKAQTAANSEWHAAQKHAFRIAHEFRNLTPLSELFQAARECKAVRATELLSFACFVCGDVEGGEACALKWDAKSMTFGLKKGREVSADAVAASDAQAWFEWAKPAKTTVPSFKALLAAVRRTNAQVEKGELFLQNDEKAALKAINEALSLMGK